MEELWKVRDLLTDIKRKVILNSYYTREIKDGKTFQASIVDWIFISIFLMMFFIVTIFNSTKSILKSIIFTGILMVFYLVFATMWRGKIRRGKIRDINQQLATEQVSRQMERYSNRDFITYIKKMLEKYYSTRFEDRDNNIDFVGTIDGEFYGIKCIKNSLDTRVTLRNIEYFIMEMEREGIEEGIVVTNTSFVDEVKDRTDYLLIGFDQIKNMLLKTEDISYPNREEIEDLIVDRYESGRKELLENMKSHRKGKIYKFILLGITFYLVSSLVAYPIYYKLVGLMSVLYGLIIGIYNLILYVRDRKKVEV